MFSDAVRGVALECQAAKFAKSGSFGMPSSCHLRSNLAIGGVRGEEGKDIESGKQGALVLGGIEDRHHLRKLAG